MVSLTLLGAFGASLSAVGQDVATESAPAEKPLLRDFPYSGYALRQVIPLEKLPPRITFKKGEVSLIQDPQDRTGLPRFAYEDPYLVVYLVNDTDEPIRGIIGELQKVHSQVRFGGNWYSREPMRLVCASVPPPTDLPARCALALGGLSDQRGDTGGEIRYLFSTPNGTITSEPQRGRYFAADLQAVLADEEMEPDLGLTLHEGSLKHLWQNSIAATNDEEFCALVELVRHHQLAIRQRAVLMDWLLERAAKHDATPEQQQVIKCLKGTLAKPWLIDNDGQTLADRCIAALEAKPSNVYGTPEKCRACVWRFVALRFPGCGAVWRGHESKRADDASVARLIELAKAALAASDPEIADAAAGFLGNGRVTEAMFPSAELVRLLESDRPLRILAGLYGLACRKRLRDAAPWLLARTEANDPHVADFYQACRPGLRGEIEDWERAVLIHLFEAAPLKTLGMISVNYVPDRQAKLPQECMIGLRRFLNDQLTDERKHWWKAAAERGQRGQLEREHQVDCQALSAGIRILDSLNDPADVPLLQSLLTHPAAQTDGYSDGSRTVFFTARDTAKGCLTRRHLKVPDSVVTKIQLKPPAPPARPAGRVRGDPARP